MSDVAALLTGRASAAPEEAGSWLGELKDALSIPGLGRYGADAGAIPGLVEAARQASSMRANPIALTDAELTGILHRSL
jgi:alcohol dehydrogenase class IV